MSRAVRLLVLVIASLGLLAVIAYFGLTRTTRSWFETDLTNRSSLAVAAARQSLLQSWQEHPAQLKKTLADITREERILGAAACSSSGELLAATGIQPEPFSCRQLADAIKKDAPAAGASWSTRDEVLGDGALLTMSPVTGGGKQLGFVALVHDLSYITGREATTRTLFLIGFAVLALLVIVATVLANRLAWRDWTSAMRNALRPTVAGARQSSEPAFQPLVRDVRSLVDQLVEERDRDGGNGTWSPQRLRATLTQYLHGERVVILANREPYVHVRDDLGIHVQHPASGLVTALEPVMRACSGVWVAHGSGSADRESSDAKGRVMVPPGEESYMLRRVWLSEAEEQGYYYGFSNEGLWPLCHVAHTRPVFRAEDWDHYVAVNRRFAEAVCEEVDSDDPIVLVQDYHFALAPRMIREKLPRATIITFWHIPWPAAERISICPWREELIAGLLGSSIIGFHTQQHCNHFIDSVDAFMESRIDREATAVIQGQRRTLVRPYPISIEWPVRWLEGMPPIAQTRAEVRRELGVPEDLLLGVGIDRLDYTKGIEERLTSVDELLTRYPEYRGKFSFVQLAAPSRTKIDRYQDLNDRVEALTNKINAKWQTDTYRPIILLRAHHEPATVFRYYRAAELCYVSSLHDGMNLVAKEFVAARDDEQGVLLLSQFTGAARDLTEALIVNPYDIRQASEAMVAALRMPAEEQQVRMRSMRRLVSEFNVYRWAGRMLVDAAVLRRKERVMGSLTGTGNLGPSAGWSPTPPPSPTELPPTRIAI
jgi:trehalose 6-phosphate synthase